MKSFQSTLPRGERHRHFLLFCEVPISIHAPTRGATVFLGHYDYAATFQSTLPRGERPKAADGGESVTCISIHAPTRGATVCRRLLRADREFQSTLPRGERRATQSRCFTRIYFNPRSHEGSDQRAKCSLDPMFRFQSTLPRGERLFDSITSLHLWDFNPRSHEGSDPDAGQTDPGTDHFNPRSHEGSDLPEPGLDPAENTISIHAPTRGATVRSYLGRYNIRFQSTLPRGERR